MKKKRQKEIKNKFCYYCIQKKNTNTHTYTNLWMFDDVMVIVVGNGHGDKSSNPR